MTRNLLSRRDATRRKILKYGALASALPWVHIRSAGAAGKLNVFFWDHWVPAGNVVMKEQVAAWADKNKVEVVIIHGSDKDNRVSLKSKPPLMSEIEFQSVCGKFLPIVTPCKTKFAKIDGLSTRTLGRVATEPTVALEVESKTKVPLAVSPP